MFLEPRPPPLQARPHVPYSLDERSSSRGCDDRNRLSRGIRGVTNPVERAVELLIIKPQSLKPEPAESRLVESGAEFSLQWTYS